MKIVIDAMGGDYAPVEVVKGCVTALKRNEGLELVLVGKENEIRKILSGLHFESSRLIIVNAEDVITCNEAPVEAVRTKKESSLVKAYDLLKSDESIKALISAGSTGAVLAGAFVKIKRIRGVKRPALAPFLPTVKDGEVMVMDAGANMDCDEINLLQFAQMGNEYLKNVCNIEKPRIGLLSVGTEDEKGNELTKKTFALLKKQKDLNFVGNVEARDVISGDYDLIVTDGFAGNVLIKSIEGSVMSVFKLLKQGIKKSMSRKIGAMFLKSMFAELKDKFGLNDVGGAPLLGFEKIVLKAHGNSKEENFVVAIEQVMEFINGELIEGIKNTLSEQNNE